MEKPTLVQRPSLREKLTKYSWPKWKPTYVAKSAEALPEAFETGVLDHIQHVAFDVDGTLMNYHEGELPEWAAVLLRDLIEKGRRVSIISNAYGDRAQELFDIFGQIHEDIYVITPEDVTQFDGDDPTRYRKPDPTMLERLAELTGVNAGHTLVVGDQLMKDVVTANTVGAESLIVERYGNGDDERVARWQRPIEELARRAMGLPGKWEDFPVELTRTSEQGSRLRRVASALGRSAARTVLKRS